MRRNVILICQQLWGCIRIAPLHAHPVCKDDSDIVCGVLLRACVGVGEPLNGRLGLSATGNFFTMVGRSRLDGVSSKLGLRECVRG